MDIARIVKWLVAASLVAGIAIAIFLIDWYAYGSAVPPRPPSIEACDDVALLEAAISGNSDPAADGSVAAGEPIELSVRLGTDVSQWYWNPSRKRVQPFNIDNVLKYTQANNHKLRLSLRVELLSRSMKSPGWTRAAGQFARLAAVEPQHVDYALGLTAPDRPGRYELRMTVRRTLWHPRSPVLLGEDIIASRYIVVTAPPEQSDDE